MGRYPLVKEAANRVVRIQEDRNENIFQLYYKCDEDVSIHVKINKEGLIKSAIECEDIFGSSQELHIAATEFIPATYPIKTESFQWLSLDEVQKRFKILSFPLNMIWLINQLVKQNV